MFNRSAIIKNRSTYPGKVQFPFGCGYICHLRGCKNTSLHSSVFVLPQVFNTTSSHEHSSGNRLNVSSKMRFADIVLGQNTLHSWDYTPIDPVHSTLNLHSDNRLQTGLASPKTVYSFEVKEDTAPGQSNVQQNQVN